VNGCIAWLPNFRLQLTVLAVTAAAGHAARQSRPAAEAER
jgi:hypothetical protein